MASLMLEAFGMLRPIEITACAPCNLFWFDKAESIRLRPKAVLELFQYIGKTGTARKPLATSFRCPLCSTALAPTQDLQRTTRFTYWRCRNDHGRLITFHQFLREKNFIRPLPPADIARLAAQVKVIRCSGCGAPVDLARDTACGHCGAPIAALDPDALARTVGELEAAAAKTPAIDVDALIDGLAAAQSRQRELDRLAGRRPNGGQVTLDLLDLGLDLLRDALSR